MERRRSVRHFSDRPVPRELIELAIQAAATAPSGAHRQPWTFVAVSDPALKSAIREAAEREEYESYVGGRMPPEWLEALERPENEKPYILFPVGYPAADAEVPDLARKTLADVAVRHSAE